MRKIANTQKLQSHLREILAYAESHQPSRAKLAFDLGTLAELVFPKYAKVFPTQESLDQQKAQVQEVLRVLSLVQKNLNSWEPHPERLDLRVP